MDEMGIESDIAACECAIQWKEEGYCIVNAVDAAALFYDDGVVTDDRPFKDAVMYVDDDLADRLVDRVAPRVDVKLAVIPMKWAAKARLERNEHRIGDA
jgi:hypothetical protein